jgi:inorganic pyrophosphatase
MPVELLWSQLEPCPEVLVELPRGSVIKRRSDGRIDFLSPLPCPYNYGCIPGLVAGDGDPLDALLLGPRLPRGARVRLPVVAVVDFRDAGASDPKVVCSAAPLSARERAGLARFFRVYAVAKRLLSAARGKRGETRFAGFLPEATWRRA